MIECSNCGQFYPDELKRCPVCRRCNNYQSISQDGFYFTECMLLSTAGYALRSVQISAQSVITIPGEYKSKPVLAIGDGVFQNNKRIIKVFIPESVQRIGDNAFDGCTELNTISGCGGLRYVGDFAFRGCIELDHCCELFKAHFAYSNNAFAGCYRLPIRVNHE